MTLIAGVRCTDGLLICSDREEVGGDTKQSVRKIFDRCNQDYSIAIATAGHSALCDLAVSKIGKAITDAHAKFPQNHQELITDVLTEVHLKYVWSYQGQEDRRIALIIGLHNRAEDTTYLYLTDEEVLQPRQEYACAGIGELIGSYFLERLYEKSLSIEEAVKLMGFIAREAKDSVGGVGRETEIISIGQMACRTFLSRVSDQELPHLSRCVYEFWKAKRIGTI